MLSETTALTGAQDVSVKTALNKSRDRMSQIRKTWALHLLMRTIATEIWLKKWLNRVLQDQIRWGRVMTLLTFDRR